MPLATDDYKDIVIGSSKQDVYDAYGAPETLYENTPNTWYYDKFKIYFIDELVSKID